MECCRDAPYIGPSLSETCAGSTNFILFLTLINTWITNTCDISEICQRVKPKRRLDAEYDFVVVGGGSAGALVAGRLSENLNWKVLLIEAGGDEPPASQVPLFSDSYIGNPNMDWNYKTEPEAHACWGYPEKRCSWPRGKVLGGTGVINGMMYMRGIPLDYDNWALDGNTGWGYTDLLPFFKQSEGNTQIGNLVDEEFHGSEGPLTTERFPYQPQVAADVLKAAKELGYPVSDDLCRKQFTGFAIAQTNSQNGVRVSSARAFLRPVRHRSNLHISLNTTATKIQIRTNANKKAASGVQFVYKNDANKKIHTVKVKREVILSAGAVNSPQLLLLSGIGPKQELDKVNIAQVHQLPGVGKNLHNHVAFSLTYTLKHKLDVSKFFWARTVSRYALNRRGPLSSTGMKQVTARINTKHADPSGGNPDLQFFFSDNLAPCSKEKRKVEKSDRRLETLTITPVVLRPKSRGHLSLQSKNPLSTPLLYPNYLSEIQDVNILVDGVRIAQRLAGTEALGKKYGAKLIKEEYGDCGTKHSYDSDKFWECAVRYRTGPENHQAGSCKMGPISDPLAVVDPKLKVIGIDGLRVMDASIMPAVVSGNPAATCVVIAEKGVDEIKRKWGS